MFQKNYPDQWRETDARMSELEDYERAAQDSSLWRNRGDIPNAEVVFHGQTLKRADFLQGYCEKADAYKCDTYDVAMYHESKDLQNHVYNAKFSTALWHLYRDKSPDDFQEGNDYTITGQPCPPEGYYDECFLFENGRLRTFGWGVDYNDPVTPFKYELADVTFSELAWLESAEKDARGACMFLSDLDPAAAARLEELSGGGPKRDEKEVDLDEEEPPIRRDDGDIER